MLIVSLTTTQVRYLRLGGTINSLLSQKRKPDAIVLNISFDEPSIEQQYTSMGVIVNKTEDYGPITKLLPTLRLANQRKWTGYIVTVDDDIVYPPNHLLELEAAYKAVREPVSFSGFDVVDKTICQQYTPSASVQVLEGYAGALYPLNCFKPLSDFEKFVFGFLQHDACKYHDDVVVSAYLHKQGYRPTYVVGPSVSRGLMLLNVLPHGKQSDALHLRGDVTKKTLEAYTILGMCPKDKK